MRNSPKEHSRVKSVIAGLALAGTVSLESVAKRLGTSPRTLQRRLTEQGISFWTLVEQSRFEIAGALLRETDLKVQEIATRLGYNSPSGFSRAFARWAGCSPKVFRGAPVERHEETRMARTGQKLLTPTRSLTEK
ncbi:helix-turn-helix domain-containing protein [Tateyamaria pelophila]|uniref:helix-turn-helix domain-containing protein n=1 Tax=Tateyamaria pelophila TaxID=328415 RepID=UPI001CBC8812|nr:helix-turn-helix transcriptional regulator [Tateyamaria pelophila]